MITKKRHAKHKVPDPDINPTQHPLLYRVWEELKKTFHGKNAQYIYKEHGGKLIPRESTFGGKLKYNMPGTAQTRDEVKPAVEFIMAEYDDDKRTELKKFLDDIYHIEEINSENVVLQNAIDAVNKMQGIPETMLIGKMLLDDIEYLKSKEAKIGRFAIISKEDKKHKPINFLDFESFGKAFLDRALPVLKNKEIPDFEFGYTSFIYLIREIVYIVPWITRSCSEQRNIANLSFAAPGSVGYALLAVYQYAKDFERKHNQLFDSATVKGQEFFLYEPERLEKALESKRKKSQNLKKKYLELCNEMKDENKDTTTNSINKEYQQWLACTDSKWLYKINTKGINKEVKKNELATRKKAKPESMTRTLARWRKEAGLDY